MYAPRESIVFEAADSVPANVCFWPKPAAQVVKCCIDRLRSQPKAAAGVVGLKIEMIRAQYYLRQSDQGLLAWDVRRLVELTSGLPVKEIQISDISELDETHWYEHEGNSPTCRSLLQHMQQIDEVDISYPIILDRDGRLMDGMHRVCRAVRDGIDRVPAVRFVTNPEPDFVGCDPDELPYDD